MTDTIPTLLLFPLWVLLAAFIFCIFSWNRAKVQAAIAIVAGFLYLAAAAGLFMEVYRNGIQVIQIGNWPAPFGITLVADLLAAGMVLILPWSPLPSFCIHCRTYRQRAKKRAFTRFCS